MEDSSYFKNLAKRVLRNVDSFEQRSAMDKYPDHEFKMPRIGGNYLAGLTGGVAIGIVICIAAYLLGIPFSGTATVFITSQFALLGALMSYLNS